jgi:hypothetical protein
MKKQKNTGFVRLLDYYLNQDDQNISKKLPILSKNCPKICPVKKGQNIYNKAQFESPKISITNHF